MTVFMRVAAGLFQINMVEVNYHTDEMKDGPSIFVFAKRRQQLALKSWLIIHKKNRIISNAKSAAVKAYERDKGFRRARLIRYL